MGLYQKIRPAEWSEVLGQNHAVNAIQRLLAGEFPSFVLLGGPSGVGKTTIARLIRKDLNVSDTDFVEINAGTDGGVDDVRNIKRYTNSLALGGNYRMWLIDEAHKLTPQAQNAFLKETEDAHDHVKFIFCSTEPDKLIRPLQTRATRFDLKPLSREDIKRVIRTACGEEIDIPNVKVMDAIAENCQGSAREALVMLEQADAATNLEEMLEIVSRTGEEKVSENFCQILLKETWHHAAKAIKDGDLDPEKTRRGVLGYMSSVLLNNPKNARAARALKCYQFLFQNGKADLILATWEFFNAD
jgi:DNA polymerase-3 subunit gamma/tau